MYCRLITMKASGHLKSATLGYQRFIGSRKLVRCELNNVVFYVLSLRSSWAMFVLVCSPSLKQESQNIMESGHIRQRQAADVCIV